MRSNNIIIIVIPYYCLFDGPLAHLVVASFVLSAYRTLANAQTDDGQHAIGSFNDDGDRAHRATMDILETCVSSNLQQWLGAIAFRLPLLVSDNSLAVLSSNLKILARLRGESFDFEFVEDNCWQSFLYMNVRKCFYHDFFNKNGASYLTGIFCAAEMQMLSGINANKNRLHFELRSTLPNGDRFCSFHFRKSEPIGSELTPVI